MEETNLRKMIGIAEVWTRAGGKRIPMRRMLDDFMRQGWTDSQIMVYMGEQFMDFYKEVGLKVDMLGRVRERYNSEMSGVPHRSRPAYREAIVKCIGNVIAPWDSKVNPIGSARLELGKLAITELPAEVYKVPFIKVMRVLALQDNQLSLVPREIGLFVELTQLRLQWNRIESVHADIGKLRNLKVLWLSNNLIKMLPWEIGLLWRLEGLGLDNNQIEYMPITLGRLTNLSELRMGNNPPQKSPPPHIAKQGNKPMVAYLRLLDTGDITGRLELKSLSLVKFPHEILLPFLFKRLRQGSTLTALDLSNNEISDIKDEYHAFGVKYSVGKQLSCLTSLSLNSNKLKQVPHCIILLSQLTSLNMENNSLVTSLPVELCTMTNLTELRLTLKTSNNKRQFLSPPSNVLQRGASVAVYDDQGRVLRHGTAHAVIDYLRMIQVRYQLWRLMCDDVMMMMMMMMKCCVYFVRVMSITVTYTQKYTYIHMYIYIHTHLHRTYKTHTIPHTCMYICMYVCIYAHTRRMQHFHIHVYMYVYIHT
jgi:Leucine-rich repeat (LRR) protein